MVPRALLCLLLLGLALLPGCTRLPAEAARGTPGQAALAGFAALSADGVALGSAVAVAPGLLLTNAHVLPDGATRIEARRGDGAAAAAAVPLARSPRLDLALLAVPEGVFAPLPVAPQPPLAGQDLWALGAPRAGAAVATGPVVLPAAWLPGHGPGLTARMPALLGYSGGPAVDAEGRLVGLVTALPRPGAAPLLAALSGLDLDGLAGGGVREVFLLSAPAALAEAARLLPAPVR